MPTYPKKFAKLWKTIFGTLSTRPQIVDNSMCNESNIYWGQWWDPKLLPCGIYLHWWRIFVCISRLMELNLGHSTPKEWSFHFALILIHLYLHEWLIKIHLYLYEWLFSQIRIGFDRL